MACAISEIGARIAALRNLNNLSQEDLATKLHVSREVVAKWENGTRDLKTQYSVDLANALNVSTDYLLRGIETGYIDAHSLTGLSNAAIAVLVENRSKSALFFGSLCDDLISSRRFNMIIDALASALLNIAVDTAELPESDEGKKAKIVDRGMRVLAIDIAEALEGLLPEQLKKYEASLMAMALVEQSERIARIKDIVASGQKALERFEATEKKLKEGATDGKHN